MILLNFAVNQQKCVDKVLKKPAESNSMMEKKPHGLTTSLQNCLSFHRGCFLL